MIEFCPTVALSTYQFSVSRLRLPDALVSSLTNRAMIMLNRALAGDGTTLRITEFSVGCGGFYPYCPQRVRPINYWAPFLEQEIYKAPVDYVDYGIDNAICYCQVPRDEAVGALGELGLWAEIVTSPLLFEIGTSFLFYVQHFPLRCKTRKTVETFAITLASP